MATVTSPPVSPPSAVDTSGGVSRLASGLSSTDAQRRLAEFGPNEIRREQKTTRLTLLARQFASPVIWLLLGASVLSAALGELLDAMAIGAIVVVNAVIGFLQEHRAERAVMALRSMTAPRARVMRDGHSVMVSADTIVPGDLLVLEAGDVAAADARLHTAHALTTNEAPLTGESTPVEKQTVPTTPDTPLAERHDFVFMGTSIATGTGLAEVVATGMQTELGRIAHLLATAEESVTPLQRRLAHVSQTLLYICGGIVALVALAGLLRGMAAHAGVHGGGLAGGGRRARRAAGGGHDRARRRRAAHGGAPRPRPEAAGGRNARLRDRDLHGQDRHAHDRRHARARALGPRPHRAVVRWQRPAATPRFGRDGQTAASAIPPRWRF